MSNGKVSRRISTNALSKAEEFLAGVRRDLGHGRAVDLSKASEAHKALLAIIASDTDREIARYRRVSEEVVARRKEGTGGSTTPSGGKVEALDVVQLLGERQLLAFVIANRAAGLPDGHGRDK